MKETRNKTTSHHHQPVKSPVAGNSFEGSESWSCASPSETSSEKFGRGVWTTAGEAQLWLFSDIFQMLFRCFSDVFSLFGVQKMASCLTTMIHLFCRGLGIVDSVDSRRDLMFSWGLENRCYVLGHHLPLFKLLLLYVRPDPSFVVLLLDLCPCHLGLWLRPVTEPGA